MYYYTYLPCTVGFRNSFIEKSFKGEKEDFLSPFSVHKKEFTATSIYPYYRHVILYEWFHNTTHIPTHNNNLYFQYSKGFLFPEIN